MKKQSINLWIFAALMCGLSLSVTSCKDDDKNDLSPEEQEQQAQEQAEKEMMAFNVLDNLANMSNVPEDFLTGSYEPTIGVADGGDAGTRIVNTNDMETAALRFADMVEADIDEETQTYTWSDDKLGTMTYTKTNDGKSWATVDVSIKQIPHLQKIIYRSPEQADGNTSAEEGTAYYRFGDVVKKKNADGNDEYWICVRPAFYPEGKGDSHWATISPLPKKNIKTYTGSNGINYALPTLLGDNYEQSQNFAEMLFAICYPEEWEQNISYNLDNKDMRMFHDFDRKKVKYHSKYFWKRVQKAWTDPNAVGTVIKNSVLSEVFGSESTLEGFQKMLKSADGLNLLTSGYSWQWWLVGHNSPTLYRYRFTNGEGKESNMHKEPIKGGIIHNYHSVTKEVINAKIDLNCQIGYGYSNLGGWNNPSFFDSKNTHYIIRHSTGAKLSSTGKENPKEPLNGVEEVYRYNKYYNINDLDADPEVLTSMENNAEFKNRGYYTIGDVVKDVEGARWFCVQPSTFGSDFSAAENDYAYFVSYDSKAIGSYDLENIPASKELAAQMLFSLSAWYHIGTGTMETSPFQKNVANVKNNTDVYWYDLFASRDTVFQTTHHGEQTIRCVFGSTLYRDTDGKLGVLRVIIDCTKEQKDGGRDFAWSFWDSYTADPTRTMMYDDLADSEIIRKYADDRWVKLPWFDPVTDKEVTKAVGKRQPDETNDWGLSTLIYNATLHKLYTDLNRIGAVTNMYREPLIPFAVKRVKDTGAPASSFEDGTRFNHVSLSQDYYTEDVFDAMDTYGLGRLLLYFPYAQTGGITLNGKPWDFKISNKP